MKSTFEDNYYTPDAIQMESNSRDFASRVLTINGNAQAVCAFLRSRSLSFLENKDKNLSDSDSSLFVIKEVFYPEFTTRANYDICRRPGRSDNFGPLFSLTFTSQHASEAFYNALKCAKGPSLGTNFTLCCAYTLLAHYNELDWAAEYGVEEGLVRVSVGMEDGGMLMEWFQNALGVAEAVAGQG
jgi:cystathionine gamma-synthase